MHTRERRKEGKNGQGQDQEKDKGVPRWGWGSASRCPSLLVHFLLEPDLCPETWSIKSVTTVAWGLGVVIGKGPGHVPRLWLPEWLTILVPVGARAGDRSAGLPSSILVHQGPGEQPPGQRETHAWTLSPRAWRSLKRRQTLGNQEEDISLSWKPWARGPIFQCWPKATCACARCVHVANAWPDSRKRYPPGRAPPLAGCSCAEGSGSWVGFGVGAD